MRRAISGLWLILILSTLFAIAGCRPDSSSSGGSTSSGGQAVIRVEGSDTMVNLAQAWAEAYSKIKPEVSVQVSGGGSGVGIAGLIEGGVDIANASRSMEEKEIQKAEAARGKKPKEFTVGHDALAVYVHKNNPIEEISLEELAEIYGDGGAIVKWAQLGVKNAGCGSDEVTRVGRQNSSGTYAYFREAVLGKTRDFKLGSVDQSGSKDVVALVANTPCAVGYSGMGYKTPEVKWLKVSKKKGEKGVLPSTETALDGSYPLARELFIYTLGEPSGATKEYIDWILSDEGQKIVVDLGYVPVKKSPEQVADPEAKPEAAKESGSDGASEGSKS